MPNRYTRLLLLGFAAMWIAILACSCGDAQLAPSVASLATPLATPQFPTAQPTAAPTAPPAYPRPAGYPGPITPAPSPRLYTYKVVKVYPHDRGAFTEGLVFDQGFLYEGTGLQGQSSLRKVALESGAIARSRDLSADLFGEGVTIYGDKIIQLTWKSHIGFVYDKDSFEPRRQFSYPTEGWGLTHDSQRLIMSDGTATLHFLDPETFKEIGQVQVYDDNGPVIKLNELEYIEGEIFANVWETDRIARIAPQTGQVLGWIDLSGLLSERDRMPPVDVLNGIAYDAEHKRLFVTGKLWPKLFEIELLPR